MDFIYNPEEWKAKQEQGDSLIAQKEAILKEREKVLEEVDGDFLKAEAEFSGNEANQIIDYVDKNGLSLEPDAPFYSKLKYDKVYQATHDLAHLDSNEQKFVDWNNLKQEEKENSRIVDLNEIHARTKEAGVELKFREPITEGKLNYYINKELQRKDLQDQIARYSENPSDYTTKQNLLLSWASLSGGIGAWETAGYALLGFIDAPLIAGALGLTRVMGASTSLARGVKLAQIGIEASNRINAGKNVALNAQRAANMLKTAKEGSQLQKLGYDMYRFGRLQGGTPAGFLTSTIPFTVDGALTEIPFAIAKQYEDMQEGEEWSHREALKQIMYASAFATTVPIAGKTLRAAGHGVGELGKIALEKAVSKTNKIAQEAEVKGYEAIVRAADQDGKTVSKTYKKH